MKRIEAAVIISDVIADNGYQTSAWAPDGENGPVRIYVTIPGKSWKKRAQKIGYVEIADNGTVISKLDKQSGTIMGLLPVLHIDETEAEVRIRVYEDERLLGRQDEDVVAFEQSENHLSRRESKSEFG